MAQFRQGSRNKNIGSKGTSEAYFIPVVSALFNVVAFTRNTDSKSYESA